jgi:hypothetical protein
VEVRQKMTQSKLTEQEFAEGVAALMVESPDPENPNLEHNAYNWGLAHAGLLFNGVKVEVIKGMQPK